MSILITGAAGFIGSHLVERLHSATNELLVGLDNFNEYYPAVRKRSNARHLARLPRFRMVEADFCDPDVCDRVFREFDVRCVVHLGAYAGVRYSVSNPGVYHHVNVGGTICLLEAARQHLLERFVFVSSSTVYGVDAAVPFQEDGPLGIPASPYGVTKRAAELMTLTYGQLHDLPVVCLRPFSVYGPRLRPDLALSVLTENVYQRRAFPLFGDGSIRRDFTHVSDVCDGIVAALTSSCAVGETINLGNREPISMRQMIQLVEHALQVEAVVDRRPTRPEDLPVTCASIEKAEKLLGYRPRVAAVDGIHDYCNWYLNQQHTRDTPVEVQRPHPRLLVG